MYESLLSWLSLIVVIDLFARQVLSLLRSWSTNTDIWSRLDVPHWVLGGALIVSLGLYFARGFRVPIAGVLASAATVVILWQTEALIANTIVAAREVHEATGDIIARTAWRAPLVLYACGMPLLLVWSAFSSRSDGNSTSRAVQLTRMTVIVVACELGALSVAEFKLWMNMSAMGDRSALAFALVDIIALVCAGLLFILSQRFRSTSTCVTSSMLCCAVCVSSMLIDCLVRVAIASTGGFAEAMAHMVTALAQWLRFTGLLLCLWVMWRRPHSIGTLCKGCAYDLNYCTSERCPECGLSKALTVVSPENSIRGGN